ncbi:MAG TPA: AAA family ATPase [Jiangellales bacterium]|nr:AAA family ATPase [Jiangellales bacterium]
MDEVGREQVVVDTLYGRLDELRARTADQLARVRRSRVGGHAQNRGERDAMATLYEDRLGRLGSVEERLVFGRLDLTDGVTRYVGRIGLSDDEQRQLLVDWRARAAQDFYRATAAHPGDVVRRRHLTLKRRRVLAIEDELLDIEAAETDGELALSGEGALMAALWERRTGRMRDIVATIQAEQDDVIRAPMSGVLVVQGGPGTGKTAVALHRAAYLLYTHRDRIARSGVLVVGPSRAFLRYIDQVLPSLGETGVVMMTPAQLVPGIEPEGEDEPAAARLKGDLRMAQAMRRAVTARQRIPARPLPLAVDGTTVVLEPRAVAAARSRARRTRRPHNQAREVFVREVLADLARQLGTHRGQSVDDDDLPALEVDLRDSVDVRREVNLAWMPLAPQRVLADLWADDTRLAQAAPWLSPRERTALHRDRAAPWTTSDVPLLDELAELLGESDDAERAERRRAAAEREAERRYAQSVLEHAGEASWWVSAEQLAERFEERRTAVPVAERAAADRTWAYGHVVLDEAQELSPMAWRAIVRRVPGKSMTVVGDTAQSASAAGASSWAEALEPHVPGRWRVAELTVTYRTPAEVMEMASAVLAAAGDPAVPPRAVRSGDAPVVLRVPAADPAAVATAVRDELAGLDEGRLAVVTPRGTSASVRAALAGLLPEGTVAPGVDAAEAAVSVLDVREVKGLEFDVVVLVEPLDVLEGAERGAHDLYVALTRCTRRLVVVHARPLPPGMERSGRPDPSTQEAG